MQKEDLVWSTEMQNQQKQPNRLQREKKTMLFVCSVLDTTPVFSRVSARGNGEDHEIYGGKTKRERKNGRVRKMIWLFHKKSITVAMPE